MNSLEEYGALFEKLGLTEMEVQEGDFRLKLRREAVGSNDSSFLTDDGNCSENSGNSSKNRADYSTNITSHNLISTGNPSANNGTQKEDETGVAIKSPLLGIFYAGIGDKKAVKEGDCVKEGDVLCTIEAMKMMNEVKATRSGIIKKICAKDGDLVEYNQELFIVT